MMRSRSAPRLWYGPASSRKACTNLSSSSTPSSLCNSLMATTAPFHVPADTTMPKPPTVLAPRAKTSMAMCVIELWAREATAAVFGNSAAMTSCGAREIFITDG